LRGGQEAVDWSHLISILEIVLHSFVVQFKSCILN